MKGTETGKDKVKKICDILRRDTLVPAKQEAEEMIRSAKEKASEIVNEARIEAEKIREAARQEVAREKNIFQSSLGQACKQALESLKQGIEEKLFNQELTRLIGKQTQDPKVLAELIEAVVRAIEKEGTDVDLSVVIPASIPARSVNLLLAKETLDRLKENSVLVGSVTGGIQVKLHKDDITLDISDTALKELVARYIRKDFRELIFGTQ